MKPDYPSVNLASLAGKRILITGHTGFSGVWMSTWLANFSSAHLFGCSLPVSSQNELYSAARAKEFFEGEFFGDISDPNFTQSVFDEVRPEYVVHLAAQAIVAIGWQSPYSTFTANTTGTLNVLEAARNSSSVERILIITSDKVYKPRFDNVAHAEADALGSHDPYSASKAAAEMVLLGYSSFFRAREIPLYVARGGNIIGGGDFSPNRLFPDLFKAHKFGIPLELRNPASTRPWQHVVALCSGYLALLTQPGVTTTGLSVFNFGPRNNEAHSVSHVIQLATQAGLDVSTVISGASNFEENQHLSIDSSKALAQLEWYPVWDIKESVERTAEWYLRYLENSQMARNLCLTDIDSWR